LVRPGRTLNLTILPRHVTRPAAQVRCDDAGGGPEQRRRPTRQVLDGQHGACPKCKGLGVIYTDLAMMAGVASRCEECAGKRFTPAVLEHKLRAKDISQVLAMSVAEARDFFPSGQARQILNRLNDVGLGYLSLGQPLNTLSGGERQRLKLAIHMAEKSCTYVLDEPTSGLHLADVDQLLALLDRLVDTGNTVIVIGHHQAVMAHADWLIDLGPGRRPRRRPRGVRGHTRRPGGHERLTDRPTPAAVPSPRRRGGRGHATSGGRAAADRTAHLSQIEC
jgi:hypothetical protein